jgi:hypothetical protein
LLQPPYFIQAEVHEFCSCGFPHSEICGSKDACSSPQLIAACHVFHRLEVPRHPPCALSSLTIKFTQNNKRSEIQTAISNPLPFSRNLQSLTYFLIYACTVKLALCVSLLSDATFPTSEKLNSSCDIGQQSLFDYQRSNYFFRPSVETSTFKGR